MKSILYIYICNQRFLNQVPTVMKPSWALLLAGPLCRGYPGLLGLAVRLQGSGGVRGGLLGPDCVFSKGYREDSFKGDIDVDVEVDVDIDCSFGPLKEASKSVQVLVNGM